MVYNTTTDIMNVTYTTTKDSLVNNETLDDGQIQIIFLVLVLLLAVPIIVTNALTIVAILVFRKLRIKRHVLIFSLSVDGLLAGVITPIDTIISLHCHGYLWIVIHLLLIAVFLASTTHLFAIAVERYLAVVHPFRHRKWMSMKNIKRLTLVAWFLGCLPSLIITVLFVARKEQPDHRCVWTPLFRAVDLFVTLPTYAVIGVFIIFANIRIVKEVRNAAEGVRSGAAVSEKRAEEYNLARTLSVVTAGYLLALTPHYIVQSILLGTGKKGTRFDDTAVMATFVIAFSNCGWNFFIYAYKSKLFKNAYVKLFKCQYQEETNRNVGGQTRIENKENNIHMISGSDARVETCTRM